MVGGRSYTGDAQSCSPTRPAARLADEETVPGPGGGHRFIRVLCDAHSRVAAEVAGAAPRPADTSVFCRLRQITCTRRLRSMSPRAGHDAAIAGARVASQTDRVKSLASMREARRHFEGARIRSGSAIPRA